jgi:hypothetical protein
VVADLSPLWPQGDPRRAADDDAIARGRVAVSLPSAGELPSWAAAWFSTSPLFARVGSGQDHEVSRALDGLLDKYLELASGASGVSGHDAEEVAQRQRAYCTAHLEDDRSLMMLTHMFEPATARRFLSDVMFPVAAPEWR